RDSRGGLGDDGALDGDGERGAGRAGRDGERLVGDGGEVAGLVGRAVGGVGPDRDGGGARVRQADGEGGRGRPAVPLDDRGVVDRDRRDAVVVEDRGRALGPGHRGTGGRGEVEGERLVGFGGVVVGDVDGDDLEEFTGEERDGL